MFATTLFLLPILPIVSAWGSLGHQTVAYVASNFVSSQTTVYFQTLLGDTSEDYLAKVATWADSFRYTAAGRFTAPFHFIDSEDSPPTSCGVKFSRDCGDSGCIVDAISNYTTRLSNASLIKSERIQAAKFVVHFLGDIHQPLHDESLERGGNGIRVTYSNKTNNLHAIWDTAMPEQLVGGYSLIASHTWAANLTTDINFGIYKDVAKTWLDDLQISDPISTALVWATEANKYVCTTVLPDGPEAIEGKELNGTYYERSIPVIELQIARAGYRLAAWLNLVATGKEINQVEL